MLRYLLNVENNWLCCNLFAKAPSTSANILWNQSASCVSPMPRFSLLFRVPRFSLQFASAFSWALTNSSSGQWCIYTLINFRSSSWASKILSRLAFNVFCYSKVQSGCLKSSIFLPTICPSTGPSPDSLRIFTSLPYLASHPSPAPPQGLVQTMKQFRSTVVQSPPWKGFLFSP